MTAPRKGYSIVASVLVPLALQVVITVIGRSLPIAPLSVGGGFILSVALLALVAISGFAFLFRAFRPHAVLAGLLYFPSIVCLMFYFGVFFNGYVFGDSL